MKRALLLSLGFALVTVDAANAACSTPYGIAGDIIYNGTYNVLQYCNSTNWINAGSLNASGGALTAGDYCTTNGSLITCTVGSTGSGSIVLSASPTITGTLAGASSTWSGNVAGTTSTWTGNIAIGTTTTSGALNVVGTVTATSFSGAHTGNGSDLINIGTAGLGGITGTPSATTFLRGDGTWAAASTGTTSGSGTANYLAMWTGATALGASAIYQTGSSVAIGTTATNGALNVNGTITATSYSGSGASLTGIGTSSITGTLGVTQGGTGSPGLGAHGVLIGEGALPIIASTSGLGGQLFLGAGSGSDPSFATMSGDCSITIAGAITCTKTSGTALSALATASTVNLASQITGTLPVANGGTGTTTSTGTGSVVLSASPTLSGTITGGTFSGTHTGSGAGLTGIGTAALGGITGTLSSTTYLSGAGTWSTPSASLPTLTSANIWVGNSSNIATAVTPTGDVTIANAGATTVAKIAGVAVGTPTGTGNVVMSASPTLTGTITGAASNWSGSVGIGTTSPTANLHIANTYPGINLQGTEGSGKTFQLIESTGGLYFKNITDNAGSWNFRTSANTDVMTVLGSGNIGIGTTSPGSPLQIYSSGLSGLTVQSTSTNSAGIVINNSAAGGHSWTLFSSGGGPTAAGDLGFYDNTGGGTRLVIDTSGNVGIGTTSPTQLLTVSGAAPDVLINATSGSPAVQFAIGSSNKAAVYYNSTGYLSLSITGVSDALNVLASNGSVGINTTTPVGIFDVKEATNQHVNFITNVNGAYSGAAGILSINDANSAYQPLGIYASTIYLGGGNVGIGTTSPASKLDVRGGQLTLQSEIDLVDENTGNGIQQQFGLYNWDGTYVVANFTSGYGWQNNRYTLDSSGNEWIAGTLTQASDARLKKDVRPITSALQKLAIVNGVTFRWKKPIKDQFEEIGVIAQDVEKVFPQAVRTDSEGIKSVNYSGLVAPLIEAVKELKADSDNLRRDEDGKIGKLEAEIEQLKAAHH